MVAPKPAVQPSVTKARHAGLRRLSLRSRSRYDNLSPQERARIEKVKALRRKIRKMGIIFLA